MRFGLKFLLLGGLLAAFTASPAPAEDIRVAVAANFLATARELEAAFEAEHDHEVTLVAGSTGLLYAQIVQGAPFDLLLAADQARPAALAENGLGVSTTRFTYATGRLSLLYQASSTGESAPVRILEQAGRIALAQSELAPYGLAAEQTLRSLGLDAQTASRRVYGLNVGQVYAVIATGNADAGFVARSAVRQRAMPPGLLAIEIPETWHAPVHQDAIRLSSARHPEAAQSFLDFLLSPHARSLIEAAGYASASP